MAEKLNLSDLKEGETYRGEALVIESQVKQASNGPYVLLKITDGGAEMLAKRWKCDTAISVGSVMKFVVEVGSYNGKKDLTIKGWSPGEMVPGEFYKKGPRSRKWLYIKLAELRDRIMDEHYAEFVDFFFTEYEQEIDKAVAAKSVHHDYVGGWLQHTTEVASLAYKMAVEMLNLTDAKIDLSLVLAGALLHDIGKLRGYKFDNGAIDLTDDGKLMEHITLGMIMIAEAQQTIGAPDVYYQMLQHCVCAHHGKLEWGSPVTPATIEAELISLADLASSRCAIMTGMENTGSEMWSDKSFFLGREVYKGPKKVPKEKSTDLKVELNPDEAKVKELQEALANNHGYCPCSVEKTAITKCMCLDFRQQDTPGYCHCGLYRKVEADE